MYIYSLSTNVDRFSYNPDQPPQLACQGPLSSVELAKELVMSWSEFHFKPIIYNISEIWCAKYMHTKSDWKNI